MLPSHHPCTIDVCSANYNCIGGQIDSACSAGVHPVRLKVVVFVLEIDLFPISKVVNADSISTQTLEQLHYLYTLVFIMIVERRK